jgi:DUF1680 family protein
LLPGLLRYYDLTGDARALEAAVGMAQFTLSRKDEWWKHLRNNGARCIEAWVSEPMSMLYGLTGDNAYIDFTAMIEEYLESPEKGVHIPVKFPDGQVRTLRFVPECYFTSCLALHETPIVFG